MFVYLHNPEYVHTYALKVYKSMHESMSVNKMYKSVQLLLIR